MNKLIFRIIIIFVLFALFKGLPPPLANLNEIRQGIEDTTNLIDSIRAAFPALSPDEIEKLSIGLEKSHRHAILKMAFMYPKTKSIVNNNDWLELTKICYSGTKASFDSASKNLFSNPDVIALRSDIALKIIIDELDNYFEEYQVERFDAIIIQRINIPLIALVLCKDNNDLLIYDNYNGRSIVIDYNDLIDNIINYGEKFRSKTGQFVINYSFIILVTLIIGGLSSCLFSFYLGTIFSKENHQRSFIADTQPEMVFNSTMVESRPMTENSRQTNTRGRPSRLAK